MSVAAGRVAGLSIQVALLPESSQRIEMSLSSLGSIVEDLGAQRLMLVVDRDAAAAIGKEAALESQLGSRLAATFDDFTPNPTSDQAYAAAMLAQDCGADTVVGFGGGSCLDVAKVAAMSSATPDFTAELCRGESVDRAAPMPVIAVPTTSGTGSEATHFAAIYVDGRKVSVAHSEMRPRGVVLDWSLHAAMPRELAACSGLDALGQAMESVWSAGGTDESERYAIDGGTLVGRSIAESVTRGTPEARSAMMMGAHLAGRAINISKTTAAHAMSYQLTQRFGVPHGLGVALTLGHVGAFNAGVGTASCQDPRGVGSVQARVSTAARMLGCEPGELPDAVRSLLGTLGVPTTLAEAGVDPNAIAEMAEAVDPVRLGNNPRKASHQDIRGILERAWAGT